MNVSEENTAQWFLKASARIATKRRSLSVRRTGVFSTKYTETGTGSESDIKETRAREDHIKNLPVGQMEILMVDNREGTRYSHLHVRRAPRFQVEGLEPSLYPKMHSYLDPEVGVNLRFKEAENRKQRRRRTAGLFLGDPLVYETLCKADTVEMFQVESRAQMASIPHNAPVRFYDLVVQVAIIRPRPIVGKMMHPYMRRRQGKEEVTYPHPSLEPVLKRTLGVPLFQEQLLRMAMTVASFSGAEAEELRRAVGMRRSMQRMKDLEGRLRAGMTRNGIGPVAQDNIVQGISSFAMYGFPESHAASFALIAYASAFLKVHYLAAFTCGLLDNQPMGFYSPAVSLKMRNVMACACAPSTYCAPSGFARLKRNPTARSPYVSASTMPMGSGKHRQRLFWSNAAAMERSHRLITWLSVSPISTARNSSLWPASARSTRSGKSSIAAMPSGRWKKPAGPLAHCCAVCREAPTAHSPAHAPLRRCTK